MRHETHGHGRASSRHSPRVVGRGIASIARKVSSSVGVERGARGAESAVLLAPPQRGRAGPAPPREELASAGVGVRVLFASLVVSVAGIGEHVSRALEARELGPPDPDLGFDDEDRIDVLLLRVTLHRTPDRF